MSTREFTLRGPAWLILAIVGGMGGSLGVQQYLLPTSGDLRETVHQLRADVAALKTSVAALETPGNTRTVMAVTTAQRFEALERRVDKLEAQIERAR